MQLTYLGWDWREHANELRRQQRLRELFQELLLRTDGDVEQALDLMQRLAKGKGQSLGFDRGDFERRLRNDQLIKRDPKGKMKLTGKAERGLREHSLDSLFGKLRSGGQGQHGQRRDGTGNETTGLTRPYTHGDEPHRIAFTESLRGHLMRAGIGQVGTGRLDLADEDLRVHETEELTSCATVLLLDISHSMTLYGEDRITPAKKVALALANLTERRFKGDDLHLVLFGDDAIEVPLSELPYVTNGPYHTNTVAALQMARRILRKKRHPNKRIVMITDGKPTALHEPGGKLYINTFGLDPRVVTATVSEAVRCRKERIAITVFMIAQDPYLERFVKRFSAACNGAWYSVGLGNLGDAVLKDFLRRRHQA